MNRLFNKSLIPCSIEIDGYIQNEMKKQNIPGLALALIHNNQLVYGRGYGFSNVEHRVPVQLDTIFQSGSVGKQFAAMAIMILVERGDLALDVPINNYMEGLPKKWKKITLRHLLAHTSGLGDYPDEINFREDYSDDDMLEVIKRAPLDFQPGEQYSYSNLGYDFLGILIHHISGEDYGSFLKKHVFKPLGMKTARVISESDIVPNRAAGYTLENGKIKNQEWVSSTLNGFASGALYLTMYDMINWDIGLNNQILLKKRQSYKDMWSPVVLNDGSTYPYGFGWEVVKTRHGLNVVKHSGTWQGFQSMIIRVLDAKVTVVIFANLDEADVDTMASHVLEMYDSRFTFPPENDEETDDEEEE